MSKNIRMKSVVLLFIFIFTISCVQQTQRLNNNGVVTQNQNDNTDTGSSDSGSDDTLNFTPIVEITHLLDPIDGKYVKKLSLPKNYEGNFYIAGINLGTLKDKIITVRFNFGREKFVKEFRAVVGQSSQGVTSGVKVDLLTIDMSSQPFRNTHLPYDLYDYNNYTFDGVTGGLTEPVEDNRNTSLYCRGLNVEDDPTFNGVGTCGLAGNECLYAFAKIRDNTLAELVGSIVPPASPKRLAVDEGSVAQGLYAQGAAVVSQMCAPSDGTDFQLDETTSIARGGNNGTYFYNGPYLENEEFNWQILGAARVGRKGVYLNSSGLESLLFPRFSKKDWGQSGREYLGSTSVRGAKTIQTTQGHWMDGCNARVRSTDPYTFENNASCTVSGQIEVYIQDLENPTKRLIASSKDVKLQLLKASSINKEGGEILSNSFSRCESSSSCGSGECCYNNRCWSTAIVSQCKDETSGTGNEPVGSLCSSDLECSTLCCNQTTGRCASHDTTTDPPVYCGKQAGQQCLTRDFCQEYTYQSCRVVRTGAGATDCEYRCENARARGDCTNGICTPITPPINPTWNPSDPNRCNGAVNP